jgi:[protein-PII] uridylyltransferase
MTGRELCRQLTDRTDAAIRSLFDKQFGNGRLKWALVALGGYGRQELCPCSDVDIILITERWIRRGEIMKALQEMLYPLWDQGYTVGYSIRTIGQAMRDSRNDFFLRTSLLDARYLCGPPEIFQDLQNAMNRDSRFRDPLSFLGDLMAHVGRRHEKFGDASYILEPDLKDGHGGLRDYQCIAWMAKITALSGMKSVSRQTLSAVDLRDLEQAVDHLLRIRFTLHQLSGRKNDRIFFEHQEALARKMNYRGNGYETGPELMMKEFHRSALLVRSISEALLSDYRHQLGLVKTRANGMINGHFLLESGRLSFQTPGILPGRPELILSLFQHMSALGAGISNTARQQVRDSLEVIDKARESPEAQSFFLKTLSGSHPDMALKAMLETGVLERFIPEFEKIRGRTQIDMFHVHTTDLHSINTLTRIQELMREEKDLFREISDREALFLAALLHDIGKGYGRPHAETGAPVAYSIARRLGLAEDRARLVSFLVRAHLLLPDIAYKRDLSDEKAAIDCAQAAKDTGTLSMLYLLSVADARATGPRAWNEWKASLLRELYVKALHSLQRGILRDPMNMILLEQRWKQLITEVPAKLGARHGGRLWALPQAYILNTETGTILQHLKMSKGLSSWDDIRIDMQDMKDHTILTVIARDRPGLFSLLTGIMTINHLDILSSKVFTWLDGIAVDEFIVSTPWKNYTQWNKISEQFRQASGGTFDVARNVALTKPLKTQPVIPSSSKPVVLVDNDLSDFFTVIEVHSPRKFGMLFQIAQSLSSLGLDIHRALLSHSGDPYIDVFYVVDAKGEKVLDTTLQEKISAHIAGVIE